MQLAAAQEEALGGARVVEAKARAQSVPRGIPVGGALKRPGTRGWGQDSGRVIVRAFDLGNSQWRYVGEFPDDGLLAVQVPTSAHRGVSWCQTYRKWRVECADRMLGRFCDERAAAQAYNTQAILLKGAAAKLNDVSSSSAARAPASAATAVLLMRLARCKQRSQRAAAAAADAAAPAAAASGVGAARAAAVAGHQDTQQALGQRLAACEEQHRAAREERHRVAQQGHNIATAGLWRDQRRELSHLARGQEQHDAEKRELEYTQSRAAYLRQELAAAEAQAREQHARLRHYNQRLQEARTTVARHDRDTTALQEEIADDLAQLELQDKRAHAELLLQQQQMRARAAQEQERKQSQRKRKRAAPLGAALPCPKKKKKKCKLPRFVQVANGAARGASEGAKGGSEGAKERGREPGRDGGRESGREPGGGDGRA